MDPPIFHLRIITLHWYFPFLYLVTFTNFHLCSSTSHNHLASLYLLKGILIILKDISNHFTFSLIHPQKFNVTKFHLYISCLWYFSHLISGTNQSVMTTMKDEVGERQENREIRYSKSKRDRQYCQLVCLVQKWDWLVRNSRDARIHLNAMFPFTLTSTTPSFIHSHTSTRYIAQHNFVLLKLYPQPQGCFTPQIH